MEKHANRRLLARTIPIAGHPSIDRTTEPNIRTVMGRTSTILDPKCSTVPIEVLAKVF